MPGRLTVLPALDPGATSIVVHGTEGDLLIDTGFGYALEGTEARLRAAGVDPARLVGIALTHMHTDHTGGVGGLQARYDLPVALHTLEADLVHARDPHAGDAHWLAQPLAPFYVQRPLNDGDILADHGEPYLFVVHLGAQTPGHVAFHIPDLGVLLTGDLLQEHDVGWLPPREGQLDLAFAALDRLEATGATRAVPGHGPEVPDVAAAIDRSRSRYSVWREQPEKGVWHAVKRLCVTSLLLRPGAAPGRLLEVPALHDYAAALGIDTLELARQAVAELQRVGALSTDDPPLATIDFDPYAAHPYGPVRPDEWPEDLMAVPGEFVFPLPSD